MQVKERVCLGRKEVFAFLHATLPDRQWTLEDIVAERDRVVARAEGVTVVVPLPPAESARCPYDA